MDSGGGKTMPALAGLALLAAVAGWALSALRPPDPLPATAAEDEFSAERAMRHVEALGAAPRPLGARAHAEARDYLLKELAELGFATEVQRADMVNRLDVDRFLVGRVRNVVARLEGQHSSGTLLLVSHYDSRPTTPGAGDALSGVAAILEAARAAGSGPRLANDLVILITDAEELGLLGARAFVERHPWAEDVRLVVNLEARGNRGPVSMFETRGGNLPAVRGFASAVPHPYASSMSYEVYRRMPNDTDFSIFRRAGIQGLNLANTGNLAAYHTMLDRAEALDRGTLQHHGSAALGLIRHFGDVDLEEIARADEDAVYFNSVPNRLVVYPARTALPLGVGATIIWLIAALLARFRGRLTVAGVGRGLTMTVLAVASGGLLGWCFWWLIRSYLPHVLFGPYGRPYEVGLLVVSLAFLTLALVGALAGWLGQTSDELELSAGVWLAWALLGFALVGLTPGASYLAHWPLGLGALGLLVATFVWHLRWGTMVLAVAAAPAVMLWTPVTWAVAEALTLAASAAIGLCLALLMTPLAPQLAALHRASGGRTSSGAALVGVALLAWVGLRAEPSSSSPAVNTLAYAVDTETGEAWWASLDPVADDWTASRLGEAPDRVPAPRAFALPDSDVLLANADPVALEPPTARKLSDRRVSGRQVEGEITSTRGAAGLRVSAEASVPMRSVSIAGERFDFDGDPEAEGLGEVEIVAYGFGSEPLRVVFDLAEAWPVELDLIDQSWGFDALPEPPEPRPDRYTPRPSWRTDSVYVRGSTLM